MGDEGKKKKAIPEHLMPLFASGELPDRARSAIESVLEGSAERLATGRLSRALSMSRLAASTSSRLLLARAKGLMGAKSEAASAQGFEIATDMLRTFSEMRGMTMKLGQMLSYLDDALPPEARKVLALLQRDASPMPWSDVEAQFQAEFGRGPEALFASFDREPIAAASIGQVHRAELQDGTRVAVKIQYPGIQAAMRADMKNARFAGMFKQLFFFKTDTKAIMDELEQRFLDECDYRKEAEYQEAYRKRFAGHPWIVVPEVHTEYSSARILTTTFKEGKSFYQWIAADPSPEERERMTRLFYRFYLGSFYMDGLFNCDPHPGNYLFQADGKLVFLDYGCSRRFDPARKDLWIALCLAVHRDDEAELHRLARAVGFFLDDAEYDRAGFRELMRYLYAPYVEDAPFDFRRHRPEDTFRRMFMDNPNLFKLNMPADAVFLNRIGFGLVSLLAEIGSELNCFRYATQYFQGVDPDWPDDPFRRSPERAA